MLGHMAIINKNWDSKCWKRIGWTTNKCSVELHSIYKKIEIFYMPCVCYAFGLTGVLYVLKKIKFITYCMGLKSSVQICQSKTVPIRGLFHRFPIFRNNLINHHIHNDLLIDLQFFSTSSSIYCLISLMRCSNFSHCLWL